MIKNRYKKIKKWPAGHSSEDFAYSYCQDLINSGGGCQHW